MTLCIYPYIKLLPEPRGIGDILLRHGRTGLFSHAENQPWNPRSSGWVLTFKTGKTRIKKGPRKCPQMALCWFSCRKLDSELNPLVTTPNPIRASTTPPLRAYQVRRITCEARAEIVLHKTLAKKTMSDTHRYPDGLEYESKVAAKIVLADSWGPPEPCWSPKRLENWFVNENCIDLASKITSFEGCWWKLRIHCKHFFHRINVNTVYIVHIV